MYFGFAGQLNIINDLRFARRLDARRLERGLQNSWLRAAAADISGTGVLHVGGIGVWIVFSNAVTLIKNPGVQ